jgi:hypothetical protein
VNLPAWPILTDEEWQQIDHHVTTCDFPETAAMWLGLGRKAGFTAARQVFSDPLLSRLPLRPLIGAVPNRFSLAGEGGDLSPLSNLHFHSTDLAHLKGAS